MRRLPRSRASRRARERPCGAISPRSSNSPRAVPTTLTTTCGRRLRPREARPAGASFPKRRSSTPTRAGRGARCGLKSPRTCRWQKATSERLRPSSSSSSPTRRPCASPSGVRSRPSASRRARSSSHSGTKHAGRRGSRRWVESSNPSATLRPQPSRNPPSAPPPTGRKSQSSCANRTPNARPTTTMPCAHARISLGNARPSHLQTPSFCFAPSPFLLCQPQLRPRQRLEQGEAGAVRARRRAPRRPGEGSVRNQARGQRQRWQLGRRRGLGQLEHRFEEIRHREASCRDQGATGSS